MQKSIIVVIPNWNGEKDLSASIDSILAQSHRNFTLIIVDNGSTDGSKDIIERYAKKDDRIRAIYRDKNYGYTGGVNPGFDVAMSEGAEFVAPFNNDAIAHRDWLKHLADFLQSHPTHGIAACMLLRSDGQTIDSTADQYTTWGIPFPRGRDEPLLSAKKHSTEIFGASGGASMYRVKMLQQIGTLDQDFFAYYEDIDLSFRAQLAGWKVSFVPEAIVYHSIGRTSSRLGKHKAAGQAVNGFVTTQFMKNLPFIIVKNLPIGLWWRVAPRFVIAYALFFFRAIFDGRGWPAIKGLSTFLMKLPKKLTERYRIQKTRKVSNAYLWSILTHDLPPNAQKLRELRLAWWRLTGHRT